MRILLLNPNTSTAVTDRMHAVAQDIASPTTEIVPLTAPRGVPYLATRAEAVIGGAIALEMLAEHLPDADAVILAAFGDPGLGAMRELASVPVIGLAEAAMLTSCMLGGDFRSSASHGPWAHGMTNVSTATDCASGWPPYASPMPPSRPLPKSKTKC